jgi:hypothetical protein
MPVGSPITLHVSCITTESSRPGDLIVDGPHRQIGYRQGRGGKVELLGFDENCERL